MPAPHQAKEMDGEGRDAPPTVEAVSDTTMYQLIYKFVIYIYSIGALEIQMSIGWSVGWSVTFLVFSA